METINYIYTTSDKRKIKIIISPQNHCGILVLDWMFLIRFNIYRKDQNFKVLNKILDLRIKKLGLNKKDENEFKNIITEDLIPMMYKQSFCQEDED